MDKKEPFEMKGRREDALGDDAGKVKDKVPRTGGGSGSGGGTAPGTGTGGGSVMGGFVPPSIVTVDTANFERHPTNTLQLKNTASGSNDTYTTMGQVGTEVAATLAG